MILTITNTRPPATNLGFLLHKNPKHLQSFPLSFGQAHVCYPEVSETCCTVALILEIDPIRLSRKASSSSNQPLKPYVNDRPYVASSFLSVAIAKVFGSALQGKCNKSPELVHQPLSLTLKIPTLPCQTEENGEMILRKLFEPLGYQLTLSPIPLDSHFPEWGRSPYFSTELVIEAPLWLVLNHLYVLIPVLDGDKHYWVSEEEVEKLLKHGDKWLKAHPEKEWIIRRYLKHQKSLTRQAMNQFTEESGSLINATEETDSGAEEFLETPLNLNEQRLNAVFQALKKTSAKRILDLGCGEGKFLEKLFQDKSFERLLGMDVSGRVLEQCKQQLRWDELSAQQKERVHLIQGSLIYQDKRLFGYEAAVLIEVIEHLDPYRLETFVRVLFEFIRPQWVFLTTPNQEYNVKFDQLPAGKMRHPDHRFEWTRHEFQQWSETNAKRFGYSVSFHSIGAEDPVLGSPTQMGVFTR